MSSAVVHPSQVIPCQEPAACAPHANPLHLAHRLLVQYGEDLARGDDQRAQLVNLALLQMARLMEPCHAEFVYLEIERHIERAWGICLR